MGEDLEFFPFGAPNELGTNVASRAVRRRTVEERSPEWYRRRALIWKHLKMKNGIDKATGEPQRYGDHRWMTPPAGVAIDV